MKVDPLPWLVSQQGVSAVRGRRMLGLYCEGDVKVVLALERDLLEEQQTDGSFEHSLLKTAGVLNMLDDLGAGQSTEALVAASVSYLFSVLAAQPGYDESNAITPGSLQSPCDLGGFFGPYEARNQIDVMAQGAREMNHYRAYEPLLGPKSLVRGERRSSLDRAGPVSCYAWGLIPLSYVIETLCRAGCAQDGRLQPAINALLGAQRQSGGWCRNLGGHPNCTMHGLRALGAHPLLRSSEYAMRALKLVYENHARLNRFAVLQVAAMFDQAIAHDIVREVLGDLAPGQRKNGTFGSPNRVERVTAVLVAERVLSQGRII